MVVLMAFPLGERALIEIFGVSLNLSSLLWGC